jgi:prevent-host-death family protein
MNEMSVLNVMKSIVPITRFNKGEASRIFEEVQASGPKIVMKNNRPACVLMSPEKYESLMEMLSDYILREEAERRLVSSEETLSQDEVMKSLGISQAELDEELEKGYQDVLAGRTKPAGKVFEEIRKDCTK